MQTILRSRIFLARIGFSHAPVRRNVCRGETLNHPKEKAA
ncbi:hypothetical protein SAMN06265784_102290 [Paraburkholderia susongensis]|uniref:Uncharacterized protein n=1 Tax=Paraburkholderia susongensis TaxID=1515439 RepID=A0A1X7J758_9BURK|nr:hypothetical protein SAMN06265784_102290 [Paraburkholderia susongensis]